MLFFPSCCCKPPMLEEGVSDHRHERVTMQTLPGSAFEVNAISRILGSAVACWDTLARAISTKRTSRTGTASGSFTWRTRYGTKFRASWSFTFVRHCHTRMARPSRRLALRPLPGNNDSSHRRLAACRPVSSLTELPVVLSHPRAISSDRRRRTCLGVHHRRVPALSGVLVR
jgi:hypothetical protein